MSIVIDERWREGRRSLVARFLRRRLRSAADWALSQAATRVNRFYESPMSWPGHAAVFHDRLRSHEQL